jgi:hypothetical protein
MAAPLLAEVLCSSLPALEQMQEPLRGEHSLYPHRRYQNRLI